MTPLYLIGAILFTISIAMAFAAMHGFADDMNDDLETAYLREIGDE